MAPPTFKLSRLLIILGTLCYPLLVYFFHDKIPPVYFVLFGVILLGSRLIRARKADGKIWNYALVMALPLLAAAFAVNRAVAVKAYPVIISLCFAAVFAYSLVHPPTIIERLARITEPDLPPEGVIYTRKVTVIWAIFLTGNALVSAGTAIWGTLEEWTLWNSLLSYICMGLLFAGEYIVRQFVRR